MLLLRLREGLGLGILVVEHNMPFVSRLCDRLVVLDLAGSSPTDRRPTCSEIPK